MLRIFKIIYKYDVAPQLIAPITNKSQGLMLIVKILKALRLRLSGVIPARKVTSVRKKRGQEYELLCLQRHHIEVSDRSYHTVDKLLHLPWNRSSTTPLLLCLKCLDLGRYKAISDFVCLRENEVTQGYKLQHSMGGAYKKKQPVSPKTSGQRRFLLGSV